MDRLLAAGAKPTKRAIAVTLAHNILEPIERLVDGGLPMSPSIAAALGRTDALVPLLAAADGEEVQEAFALAVINDRIEAARLTLDAGADVNAFLPVHAHSTALHHAVIHDDTTLIELLLDRGARTDVRDKLWNGTPLGWARHEDKKRALSLLEGRAAG
jgi:peptide-methionine (S)-S-oxide reductase